MFDCNVAGSKLACVFEMPRSAGKVVVFEGARFEFEFDLGPVAKTDWAKRFAKTYEKKLAEECRGLADLARQTEALDRVVAGQVKAGRIASEGDLGAFLEEESAQICAMWDKWTGSLFAKARKKALEAALKERRGEHDAAVQAAEKKAREKITKVPYFSYAAAAASLATTPVTGPAGVLSALAAIGKTVAARMKQVESREKALNQLALEHKAVEADLKTLADALAAMGRRVETMGRAADAARTEAVAARADAETLRQEGAEAERAARDLTGGEKAAAEGFAASLRKAAAERVAQADRAAELDPGPAAAALAELKAAEKALQAALRGDRAAIVAAAKSRKDALDMARETATVAAKIAKAFGG